jgi:hypothetical protein
MEVLIAYRPAVYQNNACLLVECINPFEASLLLSNTGFSIMQHGLNFSHENLIGILKWEVCLMFTVIEETCECHVHSIGIKFGEIWVTYKFPNNLKRVILQNADFILSLR